MKLTDIYKPPQLDFGTYSTRALLHVQHRMPSGIGGGLPPKQTWVAREFNHIVANEIPNAVVGSDFISLPPGAYMGEITASFFRSNIAGLRLEKISPTQGVINTTTGISQATTGVQACLILPFNFIINRTSTFAIKSYVEETTDGANTLGLAAGNALTEIPYEVYLEAIFYRFSDSRSNYEYIRHDIIRYPDEEDTVLLEEAQENVTFTGHINGLTVDSNPTSIVCSPGECLAVDGTNVLSLDSTITKLVTSNWSVGDTRGGVLTGITDPWWIADVYIIGGEGVTTDVAILPEGYPLEYNLPNGYDRYRWIGYVVTKQPSAGGSYLYRYNMSACGTLVNFGENAPLKIPIAVTGELVNYNVTRFTPKNRTEHIFVNVVGDDSLDAVVTVSYPPISQSVISLFSTKENYVYLSQPYEGILPVVAINNENYIRMNCYLNTATSTFYIKQVKIVR